MRQHLSLISDLSVDSSARERILRTAHELFYRDGIRATGIDLLITRSGVAKATFYRHFPSKNALISAFLELRHQQWMAWFTEALHRYGAAQSVRPAGRLLVLAPVLQEWCGHPDFRGCAFINLVAELAPTAPEAIEAARAHKAEMTEQIARLLPDDAKGRALANAAALAFDGAIVRAQMAVDPGGRNTAVAALRIILKALDAQSIRSNSKLKCRDSMSAMVPTKM